MYSIKPTINRDWILSKISQEQIMERYTGVPIKINHKFHSPFREDNSPSCVYYYNKQQKLLFRDFGKGSSMDAFDVAQAVNRCTFAELLNVIVEDFGLLRNTFIKKDYSHLDIEKRLAESPTTIAIEPFTTNGQWDMSAVATNFWDRYGITPPTLKKYRVFQLNQAWCNDKIIYRYVQNSPGFAYYLGPDEYKLYFPLKDKVRFMCNSNIVQGLAQLPSSGEHLIITKSMKDVMLFSEYGIPSIAPQSEVHPLDDDLVAQLKARFANITLVYDYDYTGVKNVNKWRKQYDLGYAFVEGAKDLSDLYVSSPVHAERWANKLING